MTARAEDEAVRLCAELIRIDTSNHGDDAGPGERAAAEYVAAELEASGVSATVLESAPGRANVVARLPGRHPDRAPLLVHGHLDVVPADAADWSVPPFSGAVEDGCVWGRGAIDMKGAIATTLAVVADCRRTGRDPARDIVLAFTADEEHSGEHGSRFLVQRHPELFEGCREGITEHGGFRYQAGGVDLYPIGTAERGLAWLALTAVGTAGHGSRAAGDNPVVRLVRALARLSAHEFPVTLTATTRAMIDEIAAALGVPVGDDRAAVVPHLGAATALLDPVLRTSATPTVLRAGEKANVVPGEASAVVDVRLLPGSGDEVVREIASILGDDVSIRAVNADEPLESDHRSAIFAAMSAALTAEDPDGRPVPLLVSGGTDAKSFARLGIAGYGFTPFRGPDGFDYLRRIHGVDEHIPVEALAFGVRALRRFLLTY